MSDEAMDELAGNEGVNYSDEQLARMGQKIYEEAMRRQSTPEARQAWEQAVKRMSYAELVQAFPELSQ